VESVGYEDVEDDLGLAEAEVGGEHEEVFSCTQPD
jgi:hypothetical protein